MADETPRTPPNDSQAGTDDSVRQLEVQVVGQYVKDLSFENPNIERLLARSGDAPNVTLEINVKPRRLNEELFESAIEFKAVAATKEGTLYDLEVIYAGLFRLKNVPTEMLEPFLIVNCPTLIFPFLRRLVADVTREGGFPPLMLDPIDFAQGYMRRKQEMAAAGQNTVN